jgi:sortase A
MKGNFPWNPQPSKDARSGRAERHFPRGRALRWASRVLLVTGLACLGWAAWAVSEAAVVEAVEGRRLEEARAAQVEDLHRSSGEGTGAPSAPTWGTLEEGDLVGRIDIDRLGVSAIVLGGITPRTLRRAVGHIPGTALPGEEGNVGLAGHRDTFFRELQGVEPGDTLSLTTPHGDHLYRVEKVFVVDPSDVWVLDPPADGGEMVTLVTCYPFHYVGPAPRRFIVQGEPVDAPSGPTPRSSYR